MPRIFDSARSLNPQVIGEPVLRGVNEISGAATITTDQIKTAPRFIVDPAGGGINLTTPTAALIIGDFNLAVGDVIEIDVFNTADAAETITIVGGTSVTVKGTATIAQNKMSTIKFLCVTSSTVFAYLQTAA